MKPNKFPQKYKKNTISAEKRPLSYYLCKFYDRLGKPPHAQRFEIRKSIWTPRGPRIFIFTDFDRGEPSFRRPSILDDFRYFCLFLRIFRCFCTKHTPASVLNRSELFALKIRGPVLAERPVHMCAPCQYRSLPRGTLCTFFGKHDFAAFSGGPVMPGLPDDPDSKSIPIGSDPSKSVLELSQQSCSSIEGEATQSAQNLADLGI